SVSEDTDNTFSGGSPSAIYNGDIIFADYYRHDNRPDLVLSGQTASNPTTQLYFYDVTTSNYKRDTESEVIALENSSFAWGDFDLDGQIDLFHMGIDANGDPRSLIYLNRDDALINRPAFASGLQALSHGDASAGDLDNDGDMDLIITGLDENAVATTNVYLNDAGQGFVNAPAELQAVFEDVARGGVELFDYNQDGRLDVLLAGEGDLGARCRLYRNDGGLAFTEGAILTSLSDPRIDWGDYNNDGLVDILLFGDQAGTKVAEIWSREAGTDNFLRSGVSDDLIGISGGKVQFVDVQNDGWLDIFISGTQTDGRPTTRLFQNFDQAGTRRFQEAITTTDEMLDVENSAAAWGDFTADGKLDLILSGDSSASGVSPVLAVYVNVDSVLNAAPNAPTDPDENII
ncbi:MAG: VCBS repeat-containing protein, partial [Bacteroidota bacterium]